jgi:diguanylate cyclase (GGDEF)-like protein/PAS domain S-box-containing protein
MMMQTFSNNKQSTLASDIFMYTPSATVIVDDVNIIVMANHTFSQLLGYAVDELLGKSASLLFEVSAHDYIFYETKNQIGMLDDDLDDKVSIRHKDNSLLHLREKITKIEHQGQSYFHCIFEHVNESKVLLEHYRHLATHDTLTGLANRFLAKDRFLHALHNSVRKGEKLGILLCDLNEFKQINDHYGHYIGDQLLVQIGKQLSLLVREGDTVARIGGDEFLIMVERLQDENELHILMQNIKERLQTYINIEGEKLDIKISMGHAYAPRDGTTYENILKIADHKMYKSKKSYYGFE